MSLDTNKDYQCIQHYIDYNVFIQHVIKSMKSFDTDKPKHCLSIDSVNMTSIYFMYYKLVEDMNGNNKNLNIPKETFHNFLLQQCDNRVMVEAVTNAFYKETQLLTLDDYIRVCNDHKTHIIHKINDFYCFTFTSS